MATLASPTIASSMSQVGLRPPRRTSSLAATKKQPATNAQTNITRKASERRRMKPEQAASSFLISPSPSPNAERSTSVNGTASGSSRNTSSRVSPSPSSRSPTPASYSLSCNGYTATPATVTPVGTPKRKRQKSASNSLLHDEHAGCVGRFPTVRLYAAAAARLRKSDVKKMVETAADQTQASRDDEGALSPRSLVSKRMSELGLLEREPVDYWASADRKQAQAARRATKLPDPVPELDEEIAEIEQDVRPGLGRSTSVDSKPLPRKPLARKPLPPTPAGILEEPRGPVPSTYSLFPQHLPHASSDSSKASDFSSATTSTSTPTSKRRKQSPSPPLGARPVRFSPPPTLTQKPKASKTSIAIPRGARGKPKRSRAMSPPLTMGKRNPLVWQDHEITGHLLDDPMDDGTGINGVGFKPTKREEEIRRMKRRMQVEAWRAREGRADRDERVAKRVGELVGVVGDTNGSEADRSGDGSAESPNKVVRFYEG